jgi:hypothetical protein
MDLTRRSMLIGTAGLATMGTVFTDLKRSGLTAMLPPTNDVGVAVGVGADQSFDGLSDTVTLEKVKDPINPGEAKGKGDGDGQGNGDDDGERGGQGDGKGNGGDEGQGNGRDDVLRITSIPDDSRSMEGATRGDRLTFDIALSLIDVSHLELTVSDVESEGFTYEWAAGERDRVGVDTGHEGIGSPDEVWFFVDTSANGTEVTDRSGPFFVDAKPVFRTLYADENAVANGFTDGTARGEWHTRNVMNEMSVTSGWKALSLEKRKFEHVGASILDEYGDATVVGVGISRGDPFYGPSVLDACYRNFEFAGEEYSLPAHLDFGNGPPH